MSEYSLEEDVNAIVERVPGLDRLRGAQVLVTGGAGFLGGWFLHVLARVNDTINREAPSSIVCIDTLGRGRPRWLDRLAARSDLRLMQSNIAQLNSTELPKFDFVVHAASIASPIVYRQFPLETIEANVGGTTKILEACVRHGVRSALVMSSSEIYGDPSRDNIPTPETYWGHVSCTGPRACYDESKRLSETIAVNYFRVHGVPVKIARPFNNYGPMLPIDDRRLLPDIARDLLLGRPIRLHSDGRATRTFCYVADAVEGYFRLLLSQCNGESFNIGTDRPEISVGDFTRLVVDVAERDLGIRGSIEMVPSEDPQYLTDNPNRRCPDVSKAARDLGFVAREDLRAGVSKSLRWYAAQGKIA